MVTQERKLVTIKEAEKIFRESNGDAELATQKLKRLHKRHPAPPPPEGGISLSDAERKYGIPNETISRWVKRGWLLVLKRTKSKVYVAETEIIKLASIYKKDGGRGSWAIKKMMESPRS
jgi:hypothetical protein